MTISTSGFPLVRQLYDIIKGVSTQSTEKQDQVILELLRYVGFRVDRLERGRPDTPFDHFNTLIGKPASGIEVFIGEQKHGRATVWLSRIWDSLNPRISCRDIPDAISDAKELANLSTAIGQGVQLKPIVLTKFDETLLEPTADYDEHHTYNDSELKSSIGVHDVCKGRMDLKEISETHQVIVCRECGLRVVIPKTIQTYGDLREYFARYQP